MNMHERIMAGKLFTDMCEGMPEERLNAKKLMHEFNHSLPDDATWRRMLMQKIFGEETGAWIEPPFYFCYGKHIRIGQGTYINMNCTFIDDGLISIGENVLFGPSVTIATVGHPILPNMREYMYTAPVTIGSRVWIGAGAIICPGVTIGDGSVIGAGSVVVHDVPANSVAAGNPCKVIRPIGERDEKYYFRDRAFDPYDLAEEARLR